MRFFAWTRLTAALLVLAASCSGGSSSSLPSSALPPGGGNGPSTASVSYAPAVTVIGETYSLAPPAAEPFGPLAASPDGKTFYFHDNNYGTVKLSGGTWTANYSRTYTFQGKSIFSGPLWAFDQLGTLYNSGSGYLISNADSASGQHFTNASADFDLETSSISGLVYLGQSGGFSAVNGANTPLSFVQTMSLPTPNSCGFRIVEGPNHTVDISNCKGFNEIFIYSASLQVFAHATISNASHINEIAPDPDGGVWFADDVANLVGKMSASGSVAISPAPIGLHVSAIATASDGSIWVSLANLTTGAGYIGHVDETGSITTYPLPISIQSAEYLRGTFGEPNCAPDRLYFLDSTGSIAIIDLHPSG